MSRKQKYQLLPPLSDKDYEDLKKDVARHGVLVPIERDEHGELLDGHHRVRAWTELAAEGIHVEMPVILRLDLTESQKRSHVRALNMLRRHLTTRQRQAVIAQQLRETPDRSDRAIAKTLHASPSTVGMIRHRLGAKSPTVQVGQSKRTGLDGRRRGAPKPRTVFAPSSKDARKAIASLELLPKDLLPDRMLTVADATTAERLVKQELSREAQFKRMRKPGRLSRPTARRYNVLYIDPPWRYQGASDPGRTADRHYPTMTQDELIALPIADVAADNAVVFMFCPPPKIAEGVELLAAWKLTYKTCACWDKSGKDGKRIGLGSFFRQQHELLLVATRGAMPPPAPANRPPSIIRADRGAHSAKPSIARSQIEAMYPDVPRIEIFARGRVPGWDVWGLEAKPVGRKRKSSRR